MKTNLKRVSKRSLALILGILMLFSTLMVGTISTANAAGAVNGVIKSGDTLYYDFSNLTNKNGRANVLQASGKGLANTSNISTMSDSIYSIVRTEDLNCNQLADVQIFQVETANWYGVKGDKVPSDGQNMIIVSADGKSYTWGTYDGSSGDTPEPTTTAATTAPASTWKVHANFDTTNSNWEDYPLDTVNGNIVSGTITINETGDKYFGISGSGYYKEDGTVDTITRDSNSATLVTNGSNDAKIYIDVTGTYTFAFNTNTGALTVTYPSTAPTETTAPTTAPTETTAPTDPTTPVTTTYYIAADEISSWGEFRALTVGGNGTYSYYQNTNNTLTFKIAAQASWSGGVYGFSTVDNDFNASNVELTSSDSVAGQDANIVCSVNPAYIIVYHPNTALNSTDTPIICAATSLPSGGQQYGITTTNDTHSRVVVQSSAAAGATVSFTLRFDPGYELNTITVAGQAVTPDTTGTYTFTMPENAVTISVTSKPSQVVVTNKYYIRGDVYGVNNWNDSSAAMTISDDGFYEYYEVTDGTAAEFLIDKDNTKGANGSYNKTYMNAKFNGTDLALGTNGNNVTVAQQTGKYYIIVYYPNTTVNTSNAPIICAASALPEGFKQTVNVVAKDGTIRGDTATKFADMADTTITASADVTGVTDGTECQTATAKAGKEITITTTIDTDNKADYLVKGWVVNGESVGIRPTDTATENGEYTTTFTIDPLWIGDDGNLEITPVFFHVTNDTNKNDFITFYVEDFNKGANETWGNTVACYPYYYTGSGTEAKEDFGAYPGQPMLKGAGDRYYVQIAKTCEEKAISGITLNNYQYDTKHAELFSLSYNLQTYDYDDFVKILEAHSDATNIAFKFKFNGDHDNEPSTTSYVSDATITAAGKGGWEDLKNYNGDSLTNIFGKDIAGTKITPGETNYIRVISNGYDSATGYIGQYATCWYVYAPNASGGWDYVTKIAPSALVFEDAEALENSDASSFVEAYNTLQQYSDYAVQIAYEGNANKPGTSDYKRCDGKWYYTIKGQEIVGNILIQYEKSAIAERGTYAYDTYTGTGVGTVTGANPHFTNAEATDPHTFVTTLDNDKQFTFSADTTTGRYQFIGWYILEKEGAEPSFYTKDVDATAVRNKSFTFVARYNYVDEIAEIQITYNFKDFQAAEGEIAYTTDHDKSNDTANSYFTKDTLIVAYTSNDEEIAKIVAKNAPMIHSDYYDYTLNNASISYSYNPTSKIVYATATMDDTPHVYSVTVNGQKFTGYYQNTLELYADDFGLTYSDGATALWYLVDGTNETLYYDKFDLNYRFIVDKAELKVVANDGNKKSLDGKSVVYNSYYELGYKENVQKITQNFYITDYLDYAYNDAGEVVEGAKNIKYVGGGILYYSSDENGVAQNETAAAALKNKKTIINTAIADDDGRGTSNSVGYVYSKYDPAKFRYSEFLIAYQHIIGITLNNTDKNAGKHISAYSFFVYTYQVGNDTFTQIQISDTMAVATAYEPN